MKMKQKHAAEGGMLIALALILSYVETFIPYGFGVPGIKIGLANLAVIVALFIFNTKYAAMISVIRVVLSGFIFGSLAGIIYSLAGAIVSLIIMVLLKRTKVFGVSGISIAGGVVHNMAQLAMAALLMNTKALVYYFPVLIISGAIAGTVIGMTAAGIITRINKQQVEV